VIEEQGIATDVPADAATAVMIVDDHRTFTELLTMALNGQPDFEVVGTAGTVETAVELAAQRRPGIVVMDIQLGAQDGTDATRQIRSLLPEAVVVIFSAHRDARWVAQAASAGASGFAPKSGSLSEMLWILRHARNGSMLVAPSMLRQAADAAAEADALLVRLTVREREVLALMGKGVAPAQIARKLCISIHTCRDYVKAIHTKLGARSQLEAVVKAQQLGLITASEELITA